MVAVLEGIVNTLLLEPRWLLFEKYAEYTKNIHGENNQLNF